jgi:hypothetical protein
MLRKQTIHKIYLLGCAMLVLHGVLLQMWWNGAFHAAALRTFTVLSNFLVVIGFILMLFLYNNKEKLRSYIQVCIIMSICLTGLVYNFILVPFTSDAQMVFSHYSNFATHLLSMLLVLFNYFFFEKKGTFTYKHIPAGMAFPVIYWTVFISIGGIINYYPYFFMNPNEVGWAMLFVWFCIILILITTLSFLLVKFDKSSFEKIKA